MAKLQWAMNRPYEIGVDRGVLYLADGSGVAWNGLTSVEDASDAPVNSELYLDGVRKALHQDQGDTDLQVRAFTYPAIFDAYIGVAKFGFSYRTQSDTGYQIHLIYNVVAAPSPKTYQTQSKSVNIQEFNWKFSGSAAGQSGSSYPTAHIIVDSAITLPTVLTALENILYGTASVDARQPTFTEIVDLYLANAQLVIVDNGDGTWTATGPDSAIQMLDANNFQVAWPMAQYIDLDLYTLTTS